MAKTIKADQPGHSFYAKPSLNTASVIYICILIVYTGFLIYCLTMLFRYRNNHSVKVRGYCMTFSAVFAIHFYVAALFTVYPLNEDFKCGSEFWIMSTALPLGMALFQACNVRLWAYSKLQNDLADMSCYIKQKEERIVLTAKGFKKWFSRRSYVQKIYIWIFIGLFVQVCLTFFLFFGSRRFNPSTGFFGEHVDRLSCRRGYEWIPSVIWQCVWTWIIGPVVLVKTRHIKDTHFWALQTRLCVIAGLPGTPMWLCFLYISSPVTEKVDPWFPPAMWFAPGLVAMCLSSVLLPGFDMYRRAIRSTSSTSSSSSFSASENNLLRQSKQLVHSYPVFDWKLKHDPKPLLTFAGRSDFTGENILFLMAVRDFKLKWRRHIAMSSSLSDCLSDVEMRAMYIEASRVYFHLINPHTALMSVNLDSDMYSNFKLVFSHLEYHPPGRETQTVIEDRDPEDTQVSGPLQTPTKISDKPLDREQPRTLTATLRNVIAPWECMGEATKSVTPHLTSSRAPDSDESETGVINIGFTDGENPPQQPIPPICQLLGLSFEEFERISARCSGMATPNTGRFEQAPSNYASKIAPQSIDQTGTQPNLKPKWTPNTDNDTNSRLSKHIYGDIVSKPNGSRLTRDPLFVPGSFSLNIFDKSYQHVKFLVYFNTWKSYVDSLDDSATRNLALSYTNGSNTVPRGNNLFSPMTDVELFDLNLELEAERNGTDVDQNHHGVLDLENGPVPMSQVDARCGGCRNGSRAEKIRYIIGIEHGHNHSSAA